MKIITYRKWRILLSSQIEEKEGKLLFDKVTEGRYLETNVLKNTYRSQVKRISINESDLVLKIPNEKNTRRWIRFLTLFRIGEAFKNIRGMAMLKQHGIMSTEPVLAAEKRKNGMVVDSWILYQYLEGQSCLDLPESHEAVVQTLSAIHSKNLIHGDPQIRNFLKKDNQIFTIDSNPKRPGITGFDTGYEWAYLRKSYPGIEKYFGEIATTFWYQFAYRFDLWDRKFARFRKRVKVFLDFS